MARLLTSLFLGAVVTFLLFLLMATLVKGTGERRDNEQERIVVEINTTPPDMDTQVRRPPPPPPPPPPAQPPQQPQTPPEQTDVSGAVGFNMPGLDLGGASGGIGDPSGALMRDGDAQPIVRIEPRYPVQAARDGLQGWVRLSFSIMEDGSVDNVEVLEAEPRRVFDREAIRALRRWRYQPRIVDGRPQQQHGLTVQLDFTLDMAGG
ncbi:energy transducer TonB [Alkalimonas sp. MEB108]|uniref:Protein TonB n=1 Tax=Alkalimonas cellulosilytica TaxID=3058395 RepID=A0ABU7J210_9GAMM|nr:energy transducer TonB [Alkalimonas sp. MEB108]MEE2000392.1 energy transducer TonB [Alkalimonas sp. MEB108]